MKPQNSLPISPHQAAFKEEMLMMNQPQIKRMLSKLTQLEATLDRYVFQKQDELSVVKYETKEQLYAAPADEALYSKVQDVYKRQL